MKTVLLLSSCSSSAFIQRWSCVELLMNARMRAVNVGNSNSSLPSCPCLGVPMCLCICVGALERPEPHLLNALCPCLGVPVCVRACLCVCVCPETCFYCIPHTPYRILLSYCIPHPSHFLRKLATFVG